jgi:hypothetical protein
MDGALETALNSDSSDPGGKADNHQKTAENFVRRLTTIFFPLDSAVFHPDGNSAGKHLETEP